MTLASQILSSRAKTKMIQPSYQKADNIVSHRISCRSFLALYDAYKPTEESVDTLYYDTNIVLHHNAQPKSNACSVTCGIKYVQERKREDNVEFVSYNCFDLSRTRFQPQYQYDHERQHVRFSKSNSRYIMTLEIAIPGIKHYKDVDIKALLEDIKSHQTDEEPYPETVVSLSYQFQIKGVRKDELEENLKRLKELTWECV